MLVLDPFIIPLVLSWSVKFWFGDSIVEHVSISNKQTVLLLLSKLCIFYEAFMHLFFYEGFMHLFVC